MTDQKQGRMVILSGPSCIGKSSLHRALVRLHPELAGALQSLVLYNTRDPRPGEVDGVTYYFRSREEIKTLEEQDDYIVMDVRGDLQALDIQQLSDQLSRGDVFFEGNPYIGQVLLTHSLLEEFPKLSAFLSPLSRDEIRYLKSLDPGPNLPDLVTDIMRRKLLRRTQRQKTILSERDLEEIERRAGSAYRELKLAHHFRHIIPNHDGEDSENWDAFYYPVGDARRALLAFISLLDGKVPDTVEVWEEDLVP
jgi:guanylate kinase